MLSMSLIAARRFSITEVTASSTSSGDAPEYPVRIIIIGISISGVDSISIPNTEEVPKINSAKRHTVIQTGRFTAKLGSENIVNPSVLLSGRKLVVYYRGSVGKSGMPGGDYRIGIGDAFDKRYLIGGGHAYSDIDSAGNAVVVNKYICLISVVVNVVK